MLTCDQPPHDGGQRPSHPVEVRHLDRIFLWLAVLVFLSLIAVMAYAHTPMAR